jgi:hypothetical protein
VGWEVADPDLDVGLDVEYGVLSHNALLFVRLSMSDSLILAPLACTSVALEICVDPEDSKDPAVGVSIVIVVSSWGGRNLTLGYRSG